MNCRTQRLKFKELKFPPLIGDNRGFHLKSSAIHHSDNPDCASLDSMQQGIVKVCINGKLYFNWCTVADKT